MKKYLHYKLFLFAGIAVIVVTLYYYNKILNDKVQDITEQIEKDRSEHVLDSLKNQFLLNNIMIQLKYSDFLLNDFKVTKLSGKTKRLKQLIKDKPKLIFMFSELNCKTCIDMQLPNVNKVSEIIGSGNMIILASYAYKRDLIQFMRMNKINLDVYNIDKANFNLPLFDENVPFFFIIEPDLTCSCLFVPDKSMPKYTEVYFNFIMDRFSSNVN